MSQGRFTWLVGDVVVKPPAPKAASRFTWTELKSMGRFDMRDWTQWDLEHPYVAHPKGDVGAVMDRPTRADDARVTGVMPKLQGRAEELSKSMGGTQIDLTGVARPCQTGVIQSLETFHASYPAIQVSVLADAGGQYTDHQGNTMFPEGTSAMAATEGNFTDQPIPGFDPEDKITEGVATGGSTIYLNNAFFGSGSKMYTAEMDSMRMGWLARGVAWEAAGMPNTGPGQVLAAQQTMDHELGHALTYDDGMHRAADVAKIGRNTGGTISLYAGENRAEFLAEAFAQSRGHSPSDAAVVTVQHLNAIYHDNHYKGPAT